MSNLNDAIISESFHGDRGRGRESAPGELDFDLSSDQEADGASSAIYESEVVEGDFEPVPVKRRPIARILAIVIGTGVLLAGGGAYWASQQAKPSVADVGFPVVSLSGQANTSISAPESLQPAIPTEAQPSMLETGATFAVGASVVGMPSHVALESIPPPSLGAPGITAPISPQPVQFAVASAAQVASPPHAVEKLPVGLAVNQATAESRSVESAPVSAVKKVSPALPTTKPVDIAKKAATEPKMERTKQRYVSTEREAIAKTHVATPQYKADNAKSQPKSVVSDSGEGRDAGPSLANDVLPLVTVTSEQIGLQALTGDALTIATGAGFHRFRIGDFLPSGERLTYIDSPASTIVTDKKIIRVVN